MTFHKCCLLSTYGSTSNTLILAINVVLPHGHPIEGNKTLLNEA